MDYWSQGLGRRSSLNIDCRRKAVDLSIEDARAALQTVLPSLLSRLELPEGEKVVLSGVTRPPVAWRYITLLEEKDFKSILSLAMSPETVAFLTRFSGRKKFFLKLACLMALFLGRYLGIWMGQKVGFTGVRVPARRQEDHERKEKEIEAIEEVEIPSGSSSLR